MVTLPNKKRRDKTAEEYCISLKALLGRKEQKKTVLINSKNHLPMSVEVSNLVVHDVLVLLF